MSRADRLAVIGLVLAALAVALGLILFAGSACPSELPGQACPEAGSNRVTVIGLAALSVASLVTPIAFLGEFVLRRRIVYRGAWGRAARRGVLLAGAVAALAGLRLGGAFTVPVALFVVLLAAAIEWFAVRRLDRP